MTVDAAHWRRRDADAGQARPLKWSPGCAGNLMSAPTGASHDDHGMRSTSSPSPPVRRRPRLTANGKRHGDDQCTASTQTRRQPWRVSNEVVSGLVATSTPLRERGLSLTDGDASDSNECHYHRLGGDLDHR